MSAETVARGAAPWVPTDASFATQLAMVRHRMGWNIKEAALACGQAQATWRLWELGGARPRDIVAVSRAIATRTGCDYLWLLDGPERGAQPAPGTLTPPRRRGRGGVNTPLASLAGPPGHPGGSTRPGRARRPHRLPQPLGV